ncbi:MAG TPA: hypothetical protein VFM98_05335 [Ramlibacter sp.]|uniref:hypothetical protein n=1 Tax=Ramlibacter sp. TaxID=1917967 RepID=UPI002D80EA1E|nr:hypothetical protein [Ramlibacter sp.]HET8745003.1 hypothetical protein [Ramlibacter sp.]
MGADRPGNGPQDTVSGTWATETLPLAVRKELLERELARLGLRKPEAGDSAPAGKGDAGKQQGDAGKPQGGSNPDRPQADSER